MNQTITIYPALMRVLLTTSVLVLFVPAWGRSVRAKRQQLRHADVARGRNASPTKWPSVSNYRHQGDDATMIMLARLCMLFWLLLVAIRFGPNIVKERGLVSILGAIVLAAMWFRLARNVVAAGLA